MLATENLLEEISKKQEKIKFRRTEDYPFVSIVIPNKNGKENTLDCLESLRRIDYAKSRMEIVVVDSDSTDGSQESIESEIKEMKNEGWYNLRLIRLDHDKGVPYSYNTALKIINSNYNYLWKLDNDVVVDKNSLIELVIVGESSSKIGILNGKIYYYFNPKIIWSVGQKFLWFTGAGVHIGKNQKDNSHYNSIKFFDHLAGCSVLIKKVVIQKLGNLYEDYFLFYDDTELSLRNIKLGFKNTYVPTAKIWHKVHGTTSEDNPKFTYYRTRNSFIFMKRNFSFSYYIIYIIFFFLLSFFRISKLLRYPKSLGSYIKGVKDGLRH